jgi:hypothetical protein
MFERMPDLQDRLISVRRQPDDYRVGGVKFRNIDGVAWDSCSGGVGAPFSYTMMCTYVLCTSIEEGEVAHSCQHGPPPHMIKVCITRVDNDRRLYRVLRMVADGEFDIDVAERIVRTGRKNGRLPISPEDDELLKPELAK